MRSTDEGYCELDHNRAHSPPSEPLEAFEQLPLCEREEMIYKLLASMPRSQIARVHRRLAPYVQVDIIAALPSELALLVFSHLSWPSLLHCGLVSRRWRSIANDNSLWRVLCDKEGWVWKQPTMSRLPDLFSNDLNLYESDDEGVGDEEDDYGYHSQAASFVTLPSGSGSTGLPKSPRLRQQNTSVRQSLSTFPPLPKNRSPTPKLISHLNRFRHSSPPVLPPPPPSEPNYKLLHQTHCLLKARFRHGAFRFSTLQTRGTPNSHTGIIYCLQLYTYPEDGRQVLFTASKDKTMREWNLRTGAVERVFKGGHSGSILSLCAYGDFLASAGCDMRVCMWSLRKQDSSSTSSLIPVRVFEGHEDSVLCVRFNDRHLVSCSKDSTVRVCQFPGGLSSLKPTSPHFKSLALRILGQHRAAVNAVSICGDYIISASGDKSLRLWDVTTGAQLRSLEAHHFRGIAAIDFAYPLILSGSSDCHLRLFDIDKRRGWSTCEEFHSAPPLKRCVTAQCQTCGSEVVGQVQSPIDEQNAGDIPPSRRGSLMPREPPTHSNLVRSVALGGDFVVSGSYDKTVKVWDRKTGSLVADLKDKHDARIFSVDVDCTKVVSCGEDQKICIWDVSYGIDTSFINL